MIQSLLAPALALFCIFHPVRWSLVVGVAWLHNHLQVYLVKLFAHLYNSEQTYFISLLTDFNNSICFISDCCICSYI